LDAVFRRKLAKVSEIIARYPQGKQKSALATCAAYGAG
jgi:hypothetical protein